MSTIDHFEIDDAVINAASRGDADAQFKLGKYCYNQNKWEMAESYFRDAAEQGHAAAQYNLGLCYALGTGIEKDQHLAIFWCREAARQGYAAAQTMLEKYNEENQSKSNGISLESQNTLVAPSSFIEHYSYDESSFDSLPDEITISPFINGVATAGNGPYKEVDFDNMSNDNYKFP